MELYTIKLEDDKEYYIIDTVVNDNNKYLILANDETDDFTIRKVVNVDNKECTTKLDSKEEFTNILKVYHEKNKDLFSYNWLFIL